MTLAGILLAILIAIVMDEFFSWAPRLSHWLVRRSASSMPKHLADRYSEEWSAHLNGIPGRTSALIFAIGTIKAGASISHYFCLPNVPHWKMVLLRFWDVVLSFSTLVLQFPLLLVIAIAIKVEEGWKAPIMCAQTRVGQHGRNFRLLKFRTLNDAELGFDLTGEDIRVTRVGRILRRLRLDELPQLLNILRGDMAMVGPQPERPEFVDQLKQAIPAYDRRHAVRPGITGFAQLRVAVRGSGGGLSERLSDDLYYIRNVSFSLVVVIHLLTVVAVIWDGIPRWLNKFFPQHKR